MDYVSIELRGGILSSEIVGKLDSTYAGQSPSDFGLDGRIGDEIAVAWNAVRANWQAFSRRVDQAGEDGPERRVMLDLWLRPLFAQLGYRLTSTRSNHSYEFSGKRYPVSNYDPHRLNFPIHLTGYQEALDKPTTRGKHSSHGMVQELLNVSEQLYGIICNGSELRLLRNSSKLTLISYVSFDLVRMMEDEVYSEFALLFRLLHASRMPTKVDAPEEAFIEQYHSDSIEAGAAIRNRLSGVVEQGLRRVGEALFTEPGNESLRQAIIDGETDERGILTELLRLVYRILFLFVIEERDLVYPADLDEEGQRRKQIYFSFYSMRRIRRVAESSDLTDPDRYDLWTALFDCFRLYEDEEIGSALGISPLGGSLFSASSLRHLRSAKLKNRDALALLSGLARFRNEQGAWERVNYAALNVEEFGSVYERLLELKAKIEHGMGAELPIGWSFQLVAGSERKSTGSHYTPDDLVKPLIDHALVPVMQEKIAEARKANQDVEEAILSINVLDSAAGSGHFLLSAARRLGLELARIRTGEEQPAPPEMRRAVRDVIRQCIHAVDINPMAVELCKLALWLESHDPGKPLSFLDHRVRHGNALLGLERIEDLEKPIPNEAYKPLAGDDKAVAAGLRKRNRDFIKTAKAGGGVQYDAFDTPPSTVFNETAELLDVLEQLGDDTLDDVAQKERLWRELDSTTLKRLRDLGDVWTSAFFLPKVHDAQHQSNVATSADMAVLLRHSDPSSSRFVKAAREESSIRAFFHWFAEFPDVMRQDGFDVIVGNPPFLGGKKISGTMGMRLLPWLGSHFEPAKSMDICGYFFRRNFSLLQPSGRFGLIATNSIGEGSTREGGLAHITNSQDGIIAFAVPSMRWPGDANVLVALVAVGKEINPPGSVSLRHRDVNHINSYLAEGEDLGDPVQLKENTGLAFMGSVLSGKGFVLSEKEALEMLASDANNSKVIIPYLIGRDVNSRPDQSPSRWVIDFADRPLEQARNFRRPFLRVEELVKPKRLAVKRKAYRERWWQFAEQVRECYSAISTMSKVVVNSGSTKYLSFPVVPTGVVFDQRLFVFAISEPSDYLVLRSTFHDCWARKYSNSLGEGVSYTTTRCFRTFPRTSIVVDRAALIASTMESLRMSICRDLDSGLTDVYNLFHSQNEAGLDLQALRKVHVKLDTVVRDAYGWSDIELGHDFHEIEYLPENDNIRFTISAEARKEVLKRLLLLNHERAAAEQKK